MAGAGPANASPTSKSGFDSDAGRNSAGAGSTVRGGGGGSPHGDGNGRRLVRSLVMKAGCLLGGAYVLKRLTKSNTRLDHTRIVAQSLTGEKFSTEQAARDPMTYFNLRMLTCPATVLADGARVLYFEQVALTFGFNSYVCVFRDLDTPGTVEKAFWRTPERPYRQRFLMLKPCPKEINCDVEVASYAVRDIGEYRNFCDNPKNQRPQQEDIVGDIGEHLTTVYLSKCERGRRCLYEGSTPPGGFPNSWNGASRCTSELTIYKTGEVHSWDRAYDDEGNQVWGVRQGPYEFKGGNASSS